MWRNNKPFDKAGAYGIQEWISATGIKEHFRQFLQCGGPLSGVSLRIENSCLEGVVKHPLGGCFLTTSLWDGSLCLFPDLGQGSQSETV